MAATPIYLDNAATTPVREEVFEAMRPFFGPRFGNPSSVHRFGREARAALDEARERLATCLGAHPDEVSFNSCGTEGDNTAVLCLWRTIHAHGGRNAVVTSPIEHKAVLAAAHEVEHEGGEARTLAVTIDGVVRPDSFDALVRDDVAVTSVMWVNNETGVVQDVSALANRAKSRGVIFHTDAVQAFGKLAVDAGTQPFDLLSISGHKIGAPKGVGALFIRRGTPFAPLVLGGPQDRGRRAGTENVAFAVGLATAAELAVAEREAHWAHTEGLRDRLQAMLLDAIPDAVVHSRGAARAPHVLSISVPGTDSESMLMALDLRGIACSGGSACQSGSVMPSHVLSAMGVDPALAVSAIRMSFGATNTLADVERVGDVFPRLVAKARSLSAA
ncbi:MAG TPA: cysteine desulfurase family protein [Candidatus Elarobacter sp.]|nr:cysteine desulfurase family protein [Candidatus Elarobacter sp.]